MCTANSPDQRLLPGTQPGRPSRRKSHALLPRCFSVTWELEEAGQGRILAIQRNAVIGETLDPESGPDTRNGTERRRPLDIVVIAGDPPDEVQGLVLLCKGLKARGNPMDGLNLGSTKPKTRKQVKAEVSCKVVGK